MEVSKSNQNPTKTEQTNDTPSNQTINTLLQNGIVEGMPLIAEMLANAAMLIERTHHLKVAAYEREKHVMGRPTASKPVDFRLLSASSNSMFHKFVLVQNHSKAASLKKAVAPIVLSK